MRSINDTNSDHGASRRRRRTLPIRRVERLGIAVATAGLALAAALPISVADVQAASADQPPRIQWRQTTLPKSKLNAARDVIATGSDFLAVGGEVVDSSKPPRARIWRSDTGRKWRSIRLEGTARRGIITGVTETADGYVAVGWRPYPVRAYVWRSADGETWSRLPNLKIFDGALMRDVTQYGDELIAVGCVAEFHCLSGRVWRSVDGGRKWEIMSDPELILETVGVGPRGLVAAGATSGFDDAKGITATSGDGARWDPASPTRNLGSFYTSGKHRGRLLVAGGTSDPGRGVGQALLRTSNDGVSWTKISRRSFRGARLLGNASRKGLTLLAGLRRTGGDILRPYAYWSTDLSTFDKKILPVGADIGGEVQAVAMSSNGNRVVAVGRSDDHRARAWFGAVRR